METLEEQTHTNACRAAALRHSASELERKAEVMLRDAAEYRALADRLFPKAKTDHG